MAAFPFPITALYAGLFGVVIVVLAGLAVRQSVKHGIEIGDGGLADLRRAVRARGHPLESLPVAILFLAIAEAAGTPAWMMHGLGVAFVAGRLVQGRGPAGGARPLAGRALAPRLTRLATLAAGLAALWSLARGF